MSEQPDVATTAPLTTQHPLSQVVHTALDEVEKLSQKILSWNDAAVLAEEFVETDLAKSFAATVTLGYSLHGMQGVLVFLNKTQKVSDVAPVLGWFAKRGFKLIGKPSDYAEIQRRTWNLGVIQVAAFFSTAERGCKFVQVGEETKPVYKLLCDDAAVPETESSSGS